MSSCESPLSDRKKPSRRSNEARIVSLGMFRRCRFPDFTVTDATGERLTLVTRRQHQHCITMATIRQYLDPEDWRRAPVDAAEELRDLYDGWVA